MKEKKWRLRSIIFSEFIMERCSISIRDVEYKIFSLTNENTQNGSSVPINYFYCDISTPIPNIPDIYEAYTFLSVKLNYLLDRISYVSYGKVQIKEILSITKHTISSNEEFEIAIPQSLIQRKSISITGEMLELKNENDTDYLKRIEQLFRIAMNSDSQQEKFLTLYVILEEIARTECTETIKNTCNNCNWQHDTGRKKTNNFIKDILKHYDLSKDQINKADRLRNKIAHGGSNINREFYRDLNLLCSHLEEICISEIEKRSNIIIRNRLNAHITDIPIFRHECRCNTDGTIELINSDHKIPARFVKLFTDTESLFENSQAMVGSPLDNEGRPIINPFSWPEIERAT